MKIGLRKYIYLLATIASFFMKKDQDKKKDEDLRRLRKIIRILGALLLLSLVINIVQIFN